jgi:hypothetical protein
MRHDDRFWVVVRWLEDEKSFEAELTNGDRPIA